MPLRVLVAAILLFAATGLGWIAYKAINPTSPAPQEVSTARTRILVAAQPLQAGTLLKDADLRERELPTGQVPEGGIEVSDDGRAEIRGAMLRHYVDAGAPVVRGDVLRPRDRGFLAAVLSAGTRAVSIGVDAKTGTSGLISPGDLVDVILTQEFQRGDTPIGRRVVAETVLTNIRVIAVGQQITQGATAPTAPGTPGSDRQVASTVTLQVTPEQAERVTVAQRLGQLVLSLRPIDGPDGAPKVVVADKNLVDEQRGGPGTPLPAVRSTIFGADVSAALARDEPTAVPRMRVIQGSNVADVVFR